MISYSASDLSRKSSDIIADAMRRPVTITQRNKPRLVLLNIEDYRRLMKQADPRRSGLTAEMPNDLFEEVQRQRRRTGAKSKTSEFCRHVGRIVGQLSPSTFLHRLKEVSLP